MAVYAEFMAWVSYVKSELALAEIAEERAEHAVTMAQATALVDQWGATANGDRVTIAKARRDLDPAVASAVDKHIEARTYRKLVDALYDRCERGAQVLSRELSRRIAINPKANLSHRLSA